MIIIPQTLVDLILKQKQRHEKCQTTPRPVASIQEYMALLLQNVMLSDDFDRSCFIM